MSRTRTNNFRAKHGATGCFMFSVLVLMILAPWIAMGVVIWIVVNL